MIAGSVAQVCQPTRGRSRLGRITPIPDSKPVDGLYVFALSLVFDPSPKGLGYRSPFTLFTLHFAL